MAEVFDLQKHMKNDNSIWPDQYTSLTFLFFFWESHEFFFVILRPIKTSIELIQ